MSQVPYYNIIGSKYPFFTNPNAAHALDSDNHSTKSDRTADEDPVPLQRKLGNEILATRIVKNEVNDDEISTTTSDVSKKKEITWSDETYLEKITLQNLSARSASWMLERKASVGPCYKQVTPFGEPSGISICLPKKPIKYASCILGDCKPIKSGINVFVSRKCSDSKSKLYGPVQFEMRRAKISSLRKQEANADSKMKIDNNSYYTILRGKLDSFYERIKQTLHM